MTTYGLLDTSAIVGLENGRIRDFALVPDEISISAITLAELQVGIHSARDTETRARRIATLDWVSQLETHDIDADAAVEWSRMRYRLRELGRRPNVNDLWIAAVALVHGLPVVTQDDDFAVFEEIGGPVVIRV